MKLAAIWRWLIRQLRRRNHPPGVYQWDGKKLVRVDKFYLKPNSPEDDTFWGITPEYRKELNAQKNHLHQR